jgi:Spy/CpxP family protein refolding chaperone
MRFDRQLGISVVVAGLSVGAAATFARGEDTKPPADAPKAVKGDGQRPGGPEDRGGDRPRMDPSRILDRVQETLKDLNLSDEQKTKVKAIIDKARTDLQAALKATEGQGPDDRRQKVREALAPVREKINEVLDETQRDKLREKMQREGGPRGPGERDRGDGADKPKGDRPERPDGAGRPGRPGGPEGAGGPPRRGEGPGPMMIGRLRDNLDKLGLNDEQRKKVDSLLSDTEKKIRETMQSTHKQLEEILTDEQKQKMKEMMGPPREGRGERGEGRGEGPRGRGGPGRPGGPGDGGNGGEKRPPKE